MKHFNRIYLIIIFGILYIPIITLIFFSFNAENSTAVFGGFSLRWYRELFSSPDTFTALRNTLILAILSSLIATVIGTAAAEGVTTEYYGYQDNGSMTALRLIGLVNGEEANFTSVGFEITAVGPMGVTVSFVDDITNVYTSVETAAGTKTAEELGGSYIFVTEIGGIKPNAGVATFAVKTYSVDADGNKTYTDMVVVSLDTTVAN